MTRGSSIKRAQEKGKASKGMHVHEWRLYGQSMDGRNYYVRCDNRTRWMCPDCEHIPCHCAMVFTPDEWAKMPDILTR